MEQIKFWPKQLWNIIFEYLRNFFKAQRGHWPVYSVYLLQRFWKIVDKWKRFKVRNGTKWVSKYWLVLLLFAIWKQSASDLKLIAYRSMQCITKQLPTKQNENRPIPIDWPSPRITSYFKSAFFVIFCYWKWKQSFAYLRCSPEIAYSMPFPSAAIALTELWYADYLWLITIMKTKAFILKSRFIFLDIYNEIIKKKKKKKEFAFGQSAACTQSHVEFPLRHSQYKHPTKKQDASKRGSKTKKRVDKKKQNR